MVDLRLVVVSSVFVFIVELILRGECIIAYDRLAVAYDYPYLCMVQYRDYKPKDPTVYIPVSACSIFTTKYVVTSADNLIRNISNDPNSPNYRPFYKDVGKLQVYGGQYQLHITGNEQIREEWRKTTQFRFVTSITFCKDHNRLLDATAMSDSTVYGEANPDSMNDFFFHNNGRMMFGLAFIEIDDPLVWSPYVLPIPIYNILESENFDQSANIFARLDRNPYSEATCTLAGFGSGTGLMVTLKMVYVPKNHCIAAYCSEDMENCLNYPLQWYHVCFRSRTYSDACRLDQGAPLYCWWWDRAVIAILTGAEYCGFQGLPGVYTVIPAVVSFYNKAVRAEALRDRNRPRKGEIFTTSTLRPP
ncbi:hypothetical protein GE061_016344 [Apolygus lucorum]|uniref:Uncharacterized protein n=1 Tax=Apolygus lucorum TaxID=248454 RepID=A0A6A4JW83_APOLU|nr:hypothetical protein GE061_016344 [Apolygus lucorum]